MSSSSLAAAALVHLDRLWLQDRINVRYLAERHRADEGRGIKIDAFNKNKCETKQEDETSCSISSCGFFSAHPVLLQSGQRLVDAVDKLVDVFKVLGHLCCEHHINDGLPECSILVPGEEWRWREGEI